MVADETVESKVGKCSHGISKFYSGTTGKSVKGVCFFGMSLIDTVSRTSFFLGVQQVVYSDADKARIAESKAKKAQKISKKDTDNILVKGRKKVGPPMRNKE